MIEIYLNSFLLGIGLAMDASAISMANGLKEPKMKIGKIILIAIMFGVFQGVMPLIGYLIGHAILTYIEKYIPWIALILLAFLGSKMIYEGIKNKEETKQNELTIVTLFVQSIATSIDALSVGFTFADYSIEEALLSSLIIALVTFIICFVSIFIGKKFGDKLGQKAIILGGIILIAIGIEIFVTNLI